jgi:hypothetical protein
VFDEPIALLNTRLVEHPAIALFDEIRWTMADCFHEFEQAGGSPLGRETPAEVVSRCATAVMI